MGQPAITTPVFRASYVHLLEPKENANGQWLYSVSMIFDAEIVDTPEFKAMKDAVVTAKREKWPEGDPKTGVVSPFRRGEWKSESYSLGYDLDKYPEYEGKIIVTANSYTTKLPTGQFDISKQPGLVGPNPKAIFDPAVDRIYSGMYARASVQAYVPKKREGTADRVAFGLVHVQKCYDGEPLGAMKGSPEKAFNEFIPPEGYGNHADLLGDDDDLGV